MSGGPPGRKGHAMYLDPRLQQIVLCGGRRSDHSCNWLRDTWAWTGDHWVPITNSGPTAQSSSAIAYDPIRGYAVTFGDRIETNPVYRNTWLLRADAPCIDCNNNGMGDEDEINFGLPPDINGDGRPDECDCPLVDINSEGVVGDQNLAILPAHFGTAPAAHADGDLDADGDVDIADLSVLLSAWGISCPVE